MTELAVEAQSDDILDEWNAEKPGEAPVYQPQITEVKRSHRPRDLVERAVFVSIKLGKPGVSKKIGSDRISFDSEDISDSPYGDDVQDAPLAKEVDRRMISVSKKLIDCKEYKAISTLDGQIKKYIKSRCTDSLIRNGIFLLPLALVNDVDQHVAEFKSKREELVNIYGAVYPTRVDEALDRLGPEGNRSDYPAWERVRELFTFDLQYLSLAAPTVLGNINEKILAREQEKVAAQFKSAVEISCQSLREGMAEIVSNLADQLSGTRADGQKKSILKTSVEKMTDFLAVFDARNLADDGALAELVKKAKNLFDGADIKTLRSDEAVRSEVAKGFAEIKEALSGMIVEAPTRAITFDD